MKKILCSLMAIVVILSFSLTAFAETSVNYTFVDTDGFIYHFGQFDDGDTDAGIIVNGKPFSLKNGIYKGEYANAFVDAKTKNNLFGMGFIVNEGYQSETYEAVPYAVNEEGITKRGAPLTINKNTSGLPKEEVVVSDIVIADVCNNGSSFSSDKYDFTSYGELHIRNHGKSGYANMGNLWSALLKLDLTKIKEPAVSSNYILTLYGNARQGNVNNTDSFKARPMKIGAAMATYSDYCSSTWNESNVGETVDPLIYYRHIYGKGIENNSGVVLDYTDVDVNFSSWDITYAQYDEYKLNITGLIQKALAEGETEASVVIFANNEFADADYKASVAADPSAATVNSAVFEFSSREGTNPPTLTYERAHVSLRSVSLDGSALNVKKLNENGEINVYIKDGNTTPEVIEAVCNEYYTPSVVNNASGAVISLVDGNGRVEKTYRINYIIVPASSERITEKLSGADGRVRKSAFLKNGNVNIPENSTYTTVVARGEGAKISSSYIYSGGLMQLNLSDILPYLDKSEPVTLQLYVKPALNNNTTERNINISLYDVGAVDFTSGNLLDALRKEEIISKPCITTQAVSNSYNARCDFDITDFAIECAENGNYNPVIGINATYPTFSGNDGTQADNGTVYVYLNYDSTQYSNIAYSVHSEEAIAEYKAELGSLTVNGKALNLMRVNEEDTITAYLPYGTQLPVTVTAAGVFGNNAVITQDGEDVKVTVSAKKGTASKTYTVKFVVSEEESEAASTGITEANGILVNSASSNNNAVKLINQNQYVQFVNNVGRTSSSYIPSVGFLKLNLAPVLADYDKGEDVLLNVATYISSVHNPSVERGVNLNVYYTDKALDFSDKNALYEDQKLSSGILGECKLITSQNIKNANSGDGFDYSSNLGVYSYDISELLRYCSENNLTEVTLVLGTEYECVDSTRIDAVQSYLYLNYGSYPSATISFSR